MMQHAHKVYYVAMLACAKVVPLVALGINFEGWCTFLPKGGAVPMINSLYLYRHIALLLQIICNCDLLDMLYIHCDFVLMLEMNDSQPFSFGGWLSLVWSDGRTL